jgi:hypothetical protein
VPESARYATAAALGLDPLDARQVYFFDTPDLSLNREGVALRTRRVQRTGGDSITKCGPAEAFMAAAETRAFLSGRGIDLSGEQRTKTLKALGFFATRG